MKPYKELTYQGKARRLRQLALNGLAQYDLKIADVRLVGLFSNDLFRARTTSGQSYIVRVCLPEWRTDTDLNSEVMWLQALNRDTDIRVPEPRPARNGDVIVKASAPGVPQPRRCMVMSWLPGVQLGTRLTEENVKKMGILLARLHQHALHFSPPRGFTHLKFDSIYARGEKDILFDETCREAFPNDAREIFKCATEKLQHAFKRRYADPAGLRVIHHDLHHDNINIYYGRLYPLDFEDTIWGYPVQDIATVFYDLMMDTKRGVFGPLRHAFQEGYERVSPWPEVYTEEIDTFHAGYLIKTTNWVARFEREYLQKHSEWLAPILESFLETGKVRRQQ